MALPPLPDVFGNYTLRGFEEITAPETVSWIPTAPGWRVLLAIAVFWLAWKTWQSARRWWRNRYRRYALAGLREILNGKAGTAEKLGLVAALLKATALQAFERQDIAALTGTAWIDWLNGLTPRPLFQEEQQRLLTVEAYRASPELDERQLQLLGKAIERWIGTHQEPAHD